MLKRLPLYPFLVALYPVLALGAYNITQILPEDILRPLVLSIVMTAIIFGLMRLALGNWDRAALLTSLLLVLFFSYGQVYEGAKIAGITFLRHRLLLLIWGLLLIGAIIYIARRPSNFAAWTPWLNLIFALLLIYPLFTIVSDLFRQRQATSQAEIAPTNLPPAVANEPDIYFIVLDAYARVDSLQEDFGYDNGPFLESLKQRGFYIPECNQSNYAQTVLSLASTLNYVYLDALGPQFRQPQSKGNYVIHSAVRQFLESRGYKTVSFATGFGFTDIRDDYKRFSPRFQNSVASPFEAMLVSTTALRLLHDFGFIDLEKVSYEEYFRQRTHTAFNGLTQVPEISGPTFTFAHIIPPHPPYVFGANGENAYYANSIHYNDNLLTPEQNAKGYRDQVNYVNQEVLRVVDAILAKSAQPPVIIIEGDHGGPLVSHNHRMRNFMAFYAPKAHDMLYSGITPVNSFRVIFDSYFGQSLPLLEDRSYYSPYGGWTQFTEIPQSCSEK